jgi:hypothetical protein
MSLAEAAHGGLGWVTTHDRKEKMALLVREAMRTGRVSYHPNFFSISLGAHAAKKRLGDELRNFSVVVDAPKTHFAKTRKTCVPLSHPHTRTPAHPHTRTPAHPHTRTPAGIRGSWAGSKMIV